MKAIILYDSKSVGGSTDKFVDALGKSLAETGAYVEKGKCKANADYSFILDFDVVIMGAPVYYLAVSSELIGALIQSNLKKYLKRKKVAVFVTCGSPEPMAYMLYLPQIKVHLLRNKIIAERVFPAQDLSNEDAIDEYIDTIVETYNKTVSDRKSNVTWTEEAIETLNNVPSFLHEKFRRMAEEYAEETGQTKITSEMLFVAKDEMGGI